MYAHLLAKWHYFLPVCWPWPALSLSQLLVPTLAADSSAKQNQSQTRRHRNLKIKCCLCSNFLSLSEESMNLFGMYMNIHDCHLRHMPSSRKTNLGIEIELKNFEIFAKSFGAKAHDDILLQGRLLRSPHEEHLVFSWLSWVTTFSSDFLYLSIFFYIFLGCFMMSLHSSVFHGSQNQRSWLRCCDTHLRPLPRRPRRAQKNIEKGRNRTRCDSTTPTFSIRWLGLRSQLRISLRSSASRLTEPEKISQQNTSEMHWNALKCNKICEDQKQKKRCCCFFLARQLALRQRELCSREGAASSRPGFRMRLEISLIESLYIFVCLLTWYSSSSSSIHHVYHFYGALFDVFDAYWLDSGLVVPALWIAQSARMAHGRWVCALDQPAWAPWLKNSSWIQRHAWNFVKSSSTNITESHPSEWQQIYATMQQRCIRFDQSSGSNTSTSTSPERRYHPGTAVRPTGSGRAPEHRPAGPGGPDPTTRVAASVRVGFFGCFWFGRHGFSDFHSECRLSTATGLPAIFKCFFFKALGERHCS